MVTTPKRPLSSAEQRIAATIRQHYYPEGGWGWVVCVCVCLVNGLSWGMQLNYGVMHAAASPAVRRGERRRSPRVRAVFAVSGPCLSTRRLHHQELVTSWIRICWCTSTYRAVLVNHLSLYVIIAVLSAFIPGCTCVLMYSSANNTRLKNNAEGIRQYVLEAFVEQKDGE
ncbi:hypothetical protein MTO96_010864 [Rhipicephalus appendiculatus]